MYVRTPGGIPHGPRERRRPGTGVRDRPRSAYVFGNLSAPRTTSVYLRGRYKLYNKYIDRTAAKTRTKRRALPPRKWPKCFIGEFPGAKTYLAN